MTPRSCRYFASSEKSCALDMDPPAGLATIWTYDTGGAGPAQIRWADEEIDDAEARPDDRGTGGVDLGALAGAGADGGGVGLGRALPLRPSHRAVRRSHPPLARPVGLADVAGHGHSPPEVRA